MYFYPGQGKTPQPSAKLKREQLLREKFDECERAFPRLPPKLREWFTYYRQGKGLATLPEDLQREMRKLFGRLQNEFDGRFPGTAPPLMADGEQTRAESRANGKAKKEPACPAYDAEMKAIVNSDVTMFSTEITNYWAKLLMDYVGFQGSNSRAPSKESESEDEKRLAYGYGCCFQLANQGRLPFETEMVIKKLFTNSDIVSLWKKKLETRGSIIEETGSIPSLAVKSQSNLAFWLYTVDNLNKDSRLPPGAEWLSQNFRLACELQGYLAFASSIGGEQNIAPGITHDMDRWAKWQAAVRALHADGDLPPYVSLEIKDRTKLLES